MSKFTTRAIVLGVALATGLTGAAQAGSLNIWAASQADTAQLEGARYRGHYRRHHHGIDPGAAFAIGAIGAIAGAAAIASQRERYYYDDCDPSYELCGRRVYGDDYYDDDYGYDDYPRPRRPNHYPTDLD